MSETPFAEVADRCWVARYPMFDVNVTVVAGDAGLVVVDTNASARVGTQVLADVRRLSDAPLLAAVNTHAHFDHSFGNAAFSEAGAELVCHEGAAAELPGHAAQVREEARARVGEDGYDAIAATDVAVPGRTFSSALALDLGDRQLELVHPGRGHTGGDLVVRVADADVLLAGDLVEESGDPGYGEDSWPLEWPGTLDLVLGLVTPGTVVVPGHGAPVDRDFVVEQHTAITRVAETVRGLAGRGVPVDAALAAADWPFATASLEHAVRRGYAQLPPAGRQLPRAR